MNYFEPQVTLLKETHMDQPDNYFLHVTTMMDQSNLVAMGHDPIPTQLNSEGVFPIMLKYGVDPNLQNLSVDTPIVHTIELGPLPTEPTDFIIDIGIIDHVRTEGDGPKGKSTVRSVEAGEIERPFV